MAARAYWQGQIRLALVSDSESTAEALHRLVEILD